MALDKQRILTELGNVVNQLQSADCGCMGKLFGNPGQDPGMGSPCSGFQRGCCHGQRCNYNHTVPFAGEPYSAPANHNMNRMCMGNCNPPKLYADTYNYLNKNLMQPVVQEVYHDLKTINPTNTIMNNPMGGQMGLSSNNAALKGNMAGMNHIPISGGIPNYENSEMPGGSKSYQNAGQNMVRMPNCKMPMDNMNAMRQANQPMNQPMGPAGNIGGMGAQITSMMMGNNVKQISNMPSSPNIDSSQFFQTDAGPTPSNADTCNNSMGMNKIVYNQENANPGMQIPATQYMTQANIHHTPDMQLNSTKTNMPQNNKISNLQGLGQINTSPVGQQIISTNKYNRGHGQHNLGISKFNEMFPGVMQGGDLGFDPMSIALQMNPANHQKTAIDAMQKIMDSNSRKSFDKTKNSDYTETATANIAQAGQQGTIPGGQSTNQQMTTLQAVLPNTISNQLQPTQQISNCNAVCPNQTLQQKQQIYTGITETSMNPQIPQYQHQYQQLQNQQQQQMCDPNTGAAIISPNLPGDQYGQTDPTQLQTPPQSQNYLPTKSLSPQALIKEPIFPADTLTNRIPQKLKSQNYQYNTLGQPIEMTSAKIYHLAEPPLPQTLSPQPVSAKYDSKYSNVKNTVSRTSLMGHSPVGRAPSRNQLQTIYNQYKGSRSYTQQNDKAPHDMTYSDRKLNVMPGNGNAPHSQLHQVEKVGGDTLTNNNTENNHIPSNVEQDMGQIGDVPTPNMPAGDGVYKTEPPAKQTKHRNGLQDMTYTSYPTSAAWSFHGVYPRPSISANYKYTR